MNKTLRKLENSNLLAQLEFTSCSVWHAKHFPTSTLTRRIMVPLWCFFFFLFCFFRAFVRVNVVISSCAKYTTLQVKVHPHFHSNKFRIAFKVAGEMFVFV